jgi:hypothetical protein
MGANPSRERAHLNQEYVQRIAADQSMATGDMRGAAMHQNRADWAAYQADQVHYKRYMKGRTFAPYALHPGPTPMTVGAGALPVAPTYSAFPTMPMGSGAIYPGYAGPTIYNPVGSTIQSYPVTTQVPVGSQTYDLCMPSTSLAPVPVAAPIAAAPVYSGATAYGGYGGYGGFNGFDNGFNNGFNGYSGFNGLASGASAVYPSGMF